MLLSQHGGESIFLNLIFYQSRSNLSSIIKIHHIFIIELRLVVLIEYFNPKLINLIETLSGNVEK